jgi:thioesterase domain-containing protein
MQRLMLLHAISSAGNGVLLNQACYHIRGPLDASAFHRAWDALVVRHAALRTAVLWEGLAQPLQVVRSTATLPFRHIDLTGVPAEARAPALDALRTDDARSPMTLGKAPLMRCTLVRLEPDHHYFIWAVHHLIVDRWSHGVLFADLRALYAAFTTGNSPTLGQPGRFKGYIEWIARQDAAAAERFWRNELAGIVEPTLVLGDAVPASHTARLTSCRVLSHDLTAAARQRAARWRTTPGALLLSAVALLVGARTAQDDVVCGVTVSGRPPDLPDADTVVGSFVNNLPARLTIQRDRRIEEWVRELQRAQGRRSAFAHVSLTDIQAWTDVSFARPLFDTLVLLNLTDETAAPWPGVEVKADSATLDAAYPLLLSVSGVDDQLVFTLIHDASVERPHELLAELESMLERLATEPDGALVGSLLPSTSPSSLSVTNAAVARRARATQDVRTTSDDTVADALLHAWRDVLGVDEIGLDDDFFALGGTSLQAARLFDRVERITGKSLPLSTLFGAGTVRTLLAEIDRPLPRRGSIVRMRSSGTLPPIYAAPGVAGNVVAMAGLARALGPDQPFFAFESPGLDGRESPLTSIDAIAERYASDLANDEPGPYHLVGVCWGAAVVCELARTLSAAGRAPTSLTLINPATLLRRPAAQDGSHEARFLRSRLELYWDEFREGDWSDRRRMLVSKAQRFAKLIVGSEQRRQSQVELNQFRVTEANKDAIIRYVPAPLEARSRIFITRYAGAGNDPRLEWQSIIEPRPDVVTVEGVDSGDAISPRHVGGLAESLRAWLRATADPTTTRPPVGSTR